jgi:hypothetical protein
MKNITKNATSDLDKLMLSRLGVKSTSKLKRLNGLLMLLHTSDHNRMSITRMAVNLNCDRRSVYRYCSDDLLDKVQVLNGFIYLRQLAMAA